MGTPSQLSTGWDLNSGTFAPVTEKPLTGNQSILAPTAPNITGPTNQPVSLLSTSGGGVGSSGMGYASNNMANMSSLTTPIVNNYATAASKKDVQPSSVIVANQLGIDPALYEQLKSRPGALEEYQKTGNVSDYSYYAPGLIYKGGVPQTATPATTPTTPVSSAIKDNGNGTYSYTNKDGSVHTGKWGDNYTDTTVPKGSGGSSSSSWGIGGNPAGDVNQGFNTDGQGQGQGAGTTVLYNPNGLKMTVNTKDVQSMIGQGYTLAPKAGSTNGLAAGVKLALDKDGNQLYADGQGGTTTVDLSKTTTTTMTSGPAEGLLKDLNNQGNAANEYLQAYQNDLAGINAQMQASMDAAAKGIQDQYARKKETLASQQQQETASSQALNFKLGRAATPYAEGEKQQLAQSQLSQMRDLAAEEAQAIQNAKESILSKSKQERADALDKARLYQDSAEKAFNQRLALSKEMRESQSSSLETILKQSQIGKSQAEQADSMAPALFESLAGADADTYAKTISDYSTKYQIPMATLSSSMIKYNQDRMDKTMTESTKNYEYYANQMYATGQEPLSYDDYVNQYKDQNYQMQLDKLTIMQERANTATDRLAMQQQMNDIKLQQQTAVAPGQIVSAITELPVDLSSADATLYGGYGTFLTYFVPTVTGLVEKVFQGAISGRLGKAALGAPLIQHLAPAELQQFNAVVSAMNNQVLYLNSGKQINEAEFKRLSQSLPDPNKTADQNKVLINQFYTQMKTTMDNNLLARGYKVYEGPAKTGLRTVPTDEYSGSQWDM